MSMNDRVRFDFQNLKIPQMAERICEISYFILELEAFVQFYSYSLNRPKQK